MSRNSLVKGTIILTIAAIVARMLGVVQRVPLQHIMGNDGMNLYSISYNVYSMLLIVATLGIPTALAKQISEYTALGKYHEAYQMYKASRNFALISGLFMTAFLYLFASYYANNIALAPQATLAIQAIAPAMLFFPVISIMRGYFQGLQQMHPTGISQVNEQILRVFTAVTLPIILLSLNFSKEVAVAGASFGAVTGSLAALGVMLYYYKKNRPLQLKQLREQKEVTRLSTRKIYKQLLKLSIPITFASLTVTMLYFIDSSTGLRLLTPKDEHLVFNVNAKEATVGGATITLPEAPYAKGQHTMVPLVPVAEALGGSVQWDESTQTAIYSRNEVTIGLSLKENIQLGNEDLKAPIEQKGETLMVPLTFFTHQLSGYRAAMEDMGILNGSAQSLAGLPIILAVALSSSILPIVSAAHSRRDEKEVQRMSSLALRLSLLTGVPAALFLTVGALPVNGFLFKNTPDIFLRASYIIAFLSFGTIFQIMMMTSTSILHGLGKINQPVLFVLIGIVVKWIGNHLFTPFMGIYGIILATTLCFMVIMLLNIWTINKYTSLEIMGRKWSGLIGASFALSISGAAIVYLGLKLKPFMSMPDFLFYGIESIVVGIISVSAYILTLFWLKGMDAREVQYMPGVVKRLYNTLARFHIVPKSVSNDISN